MMGMGEVEGKGGTRLTNRPHCRYPVTPRMIMKNADPRYMGADVRTPMRR